MTMTVATRPRIGTKRSDSDSRRTLPAAMAPGVFIWTAYAIMELCTATA
jgi:hypothetical protein